MTRRSFLLSDDLARYVADHSPRPDEVKRDLITETAALPTAGMQVAPEQGALLALLVRLTGASQLLEVGTFTGYSSLCMAEALPAGGRLLCLDLSREWTDIAKRYWKRAGVEGRITLHLGPAAETLRSLPDEPTFDLAFLDADKQGYPDYFELIVPRLRPGGLLVADNVLWSGRIVDSSNEDADVRSLRVFNDKAAADPRVETHLLALFDGLLLARRRLDEK